MRKAFLLVFLLCTSLVKAQAPATGTIDIVYGWVKQADGSRKPVKHQTLSFTATPILASILEPQVGARRISPIQKLLRAPSNPLRGAIGGRSGGPYAAEVMVYNNQQGLTQGGIVSPEEFIDPSSLDDVQITATGINKPWTKFRFSVHVEALSSHQILVRWRVFNTAVENAAGQMDYEDELADIGGLMTPLDPSTFGPTWIYETNLQALGVVVPDTDCYIAQQFRDTSDLVTANGAFEGEYYNVYNKDTMPTIGSSSDGWIFDSDALDGIYESSEFDVFSTTPPPFANMIRSISVNTTGIQNTLTPNLFVLNTGVGQAGGLSSFEFEDDSNVFTGSGIVPRAQVPRVQYELEANCPTTNILSYRATTRTMVSGSLVRQVLEAKHFGTNTWVTLDNREMPNNTWVTVNGTYGGTLPLSGFVGPGNKVRMRLSYLNVVQFTISRLNANGDLANFTITR